MATVKPRQSAATATQRHLIGGRMPHVPEPRPDPRWRAQAACAGRDPEIFYPPRSDGPTRYDQALSICRDCPVRAACLADALFVEGRSADQTRRYGVRGGTTAHERRRLAATRATRE